LSNARRRRHSGRSKGADKAAAKGAAATAPCGRQGNFADLQIKGLMVKHGEDGMAKRRGWEAMARLRSRLPARVGSQRREPALISHQSNLPIPAGPLQNDEASEQAGTSDKKSIVLGIDNSSKFAYRSSGQDRGAAYPQISLMQIPADQVDHHQVDFAVPPCNAAKATAREAEPAEGAGLSPDGLIYGFRPWEHILLNWQAGEVAKYSPCIIPTGNMWFALFWLKKRIRRSSHSRQQAARGSRLRLVLQRQQTSAAPAGLSGDGADKSERLRARGLSYQLSHPGTAHQASETPAWQLIRPRPRRRPTVPLSDLPRRSGSDNDSDDGERGRGPEDDAEETSPIRAVEIESPFFDYMVTDQLHQRRPASPPDIFAESPLNQTPIVESADLRSRRRERGSASPAASPAFPASPPPALPPPPPPPPPPQPSAAAEKTVVPQQRTRKTSRGSATEKPQAAVKSPTPLAVQNGAKSSQNNSYASKATTETKEQQAAAATATQLQKEQPSREVDRSLQDRGAGPVFLLVDSLEPSEIILSMSVLSRWPESYSVSLAASSARAGGGLDEVQRKPRDPPNPGSYVAELHNWKSPRLGQQFKRVRTSGTKAVSSAFQLAGTASDYSPALRQLSQLWVGSEEEILPQLKSTPVRQLCWAGRFTRAVADLIAAVTMSERTLAVWLKRSRALWGLLLGDPGDSNVRLRRRLRDEFHLAFYDLLGQALDGAHRWRRLLSSCPLGDCCCAMPALGIRLVCPLRQQSS
uniref:SH2 domain-containing protein n=1 Tax=Macrostomum lignano TaxID=282301 RepID=A0A1I8FAX4_9PLAT